MQSGVLTSLAPRRRPIVFVTCGALVLALVVFGVIVGGRLRSSPMGTIDQPADGAVLTQLTPVSGWAIDRAARGNTGVDGVTVYVDGQYVGDAYYGLGRTDIGELFGLQFAASGWSVWIEPAQL